MLGIEPSSAGVVHELSLQTLWWVWQCLGTFFLKHLSFGFGLISLIILYSPLSCMSLKVWISRVCALGSLLLLSLLFWSCLLPLLLQQSAFFTFGSDHSFDLSWFPSRMLHLNVSHTNQFKLTKTHLLAPISFLSILYFFYLGEYTLPKTEA